MERGLLIRHLKTLFWLRGRHGSTARRPLDEYMIKVLSSDRRYSYLYIEGMRWGKKNQ